MSQITDVAPQPAGAVPPVPSDRPAAAIGNVPFVLVLLSTVLVLIPWTRPAGLAFLLVLAIPVVISWIRARKLRDGSRGLTTGTVVLWLVAFVLGGMLSPKPEPATPAAEALPAAPVEQQAAVPVTPQPLVAVPPVAPPTTAPVAPAPVPQSTPAPQPLVRAPARTTATAPRAAAPTRQAAAPTRQSAPEPTADSGGSAYYKNCTEARAAGAAPIRRGEPGYRSALDRDGDGTACDK